MMSCLRCVGDLAFGCCVARDFYVSLLIMPKVFKFALNFLMPMRVLKLFYRVYKQPRFASHAIEIRQLPCFHNQITSCMNNMSFRNSGIEKDLIAEPEQAKLGLKRKGSKTRIAKASKSSTKATKKGSKKAAPVAVAKSSKRKASKKSSKKGGAPVSRKHSKSGGKRRSRR